MTVDIDLDLLLQTYLVETPDNLATLEEALLALERMPDDSETLQQIFRLAHSIKGDSAIVGLGAAADVAHVLEDVLDALRQHAIQLDHELTTLLLNTIDTLRAIVDDASHGELAGEPNEAAHRMMDELTAFLAVDDEPSQTATNDGRPGVDPYPGDTPSANKTLRVTLDKLDRILNLAGEISVARGRLRRSLEDWSENDGRSQLVELHRESDHLYAELQELVTAVRMVQIGPTFRRYIRVVRDLAAELGKDARLVIEGEDVELDTSVVDHLRDPLTHMIRNAIHHGIEAPDVRQAKGKDPCGRITLRAFHEAGCIVIQVADDGAGLCRAEIVERARTFLPDLDPERLSEHDLAALLLEPGFSTAETVTELSGRGVGLDVVRRNIDSLRGTVILSSDEGLGTTVTIRLPLTLAIIDGFAVRVVDETYVIPLDSVLECVGLDDNELRGRDGAGVIDLRGEPLPFLRLRDLFELEANGPSRESVVVVQFGDRRAGIAVDGLMGEMQTVIKPLGRPLQNVPAVSGAAILGDGRVGLILDVAVLLRRAVDQQAGLGSATRATTNLRQWGNA